MTFSAGARVRAVAGVVCAALLAAVAVTTDGTDLADAPGADETVVFDDAGLPQALDENGEVIPAAVGEPPEIEVETPGTKLLEQDRQELAAAVSPAKAQPDDPASGPEEDPDSVLVTFERDASEDEIAAALSSAGVEGERIGGSNIVVVDTAASDNATVTEALEAADAVATVEPNLIRRATKVPNDPQTATQRQYLDGLGIQTAWDVAKPGAEVVVAVLDTGVDLDHPDLRANLVAGYNAINPAVSPQDDNGHGTLVAGIIGAATNNATGVAGVAWNARIMPVKVLDADGSGTDADIAEGIIWAASHGADVINLSLGGPGGSAAIDDAVLNALGLNWEGSYVGPNDSVIVAAAGNEASSGIHYPAAAPGVIAVSGTDHGGQFAWFSNHGAWIDIAAPGIDITSTRLAPGPAAAYGSETGTSFSSPIVAGVAALVRERHPSWRWDRVQWEVIRTAADRGPAGHDDAYGFGLVNAAAALSVGPAGAVAQPNLSGDAGNLPGTARAITVGTPASESLAYETDEDWFSFSVPGTGGVAVTVTPPVAQAIGVRAREMDPMVEVYGPGGGLVAESDDGFEGEAEELSFVAAAGTHRVRVRNWLGSAGPSPYTVHVQRPPVTPVTEFAAPVTVPNLDAVDNKPVFADLTGDGIDDIVVGGIANLNDGVWLLPMGADGTPGAPQLVIDGDPERGNSVAAADLDGDGDDDVALATNQGLSVAWRTATGLEPAVNYPGVGIGQVVPVPFDGTAAVELLETPLTPGSAPARLLRWNGSGFSATALGLGSSLGQDGDRAQRYAAGDVNSDGRVDIVAAWTETAGVFLQQPGGSWTAQAFLPEPLEGMILADIAISDLSDDGRPDITFMGDSRGSELPDLLVTRFQEAGGTLSDPMFLATAGKGERLVTDDFTGDGRTDALLSYNNVLGIRRQVSGGHLALSERSISLDSDSVSQVVAHRLPGDDLADIIYVSSHLRIMRQRPATTPAPETAGPWIQSTSPAAHATGVATTARPSATFGRDIDPASVRYGTGPGTTVLLTDARGDWVVDATTSLSGRTLTITPTQRLKPGAPYRVWLYGVEDTDGNQLYESFAFTTAGAGAPTYTVNNDYQPFPLDFDDNGYSDIVWYTPSTAPDPVWSHAPDGRFDAGQFDIQGTFRPVAGDFDGNGWEDIFWYSPGSGYDEMWYFGVDGAGYLTITPVAYPVNGVYVPVAGDFDNNGYEDIFWYGPGATAEALWKFRAGRAYTSTATAKVAGTSYRIAAGDFNRDGFDDVFWHLPGTGAEAIWRSGPAGFVSGATATANGSYGIRSGDFNGDGFTDLYWFTTNSAAVWRGTATSFASQAGPVIAATARPVSGDFTGDNYDDLLAYVPGTTADRQIPGRAAGL